MINFNQLPSRLLPQAPSLTREESLTLADDFRNFAVNGLPSDLEAYIKLRYHIDLATQYAGQPIKNPWGKASGQLTLNAGQIREAAEAGLGFAVLKTVIAEDATGARSMGAWSVPEARMVVEPIVGHSSETGWTITWNGRGWPGNLAEYLQLVRDSHAAAANSGLRIIPSVKYHLPGPDEPTWRDEEYRITTQALQDATGDDILIIEKDFSPTLAGSDRSAARSTVERWLTEVGPRIREAGQGHVAVSVKLFNSLDDDAFQLHLLEMLHEAGRADSLVYANRLFDGQKGVAYGGPDLSDRNLRLLSALRQSQAEGGIPAPSPPISATGDIHSGRIAVEYLLRGCSSFQIHTLFCLPSTEFAMKRGSKLERAFHRLYFDPAEGFIAWIRHIAAIRGLETIDVHETAAWAAGRYLTPQDCASR